MAATNPTISAMEPKQRGDQLATARLLLAALMAIGGFGVLFSLWWHSGVTDDYEVLRIASQEFVKGRPIVAGELAETVVFDDSVELPEDDEQPDAGTDDADPAADDSDRSEETSDGEDKDQRASWISLREFLVGVGRVVRARGTEDARSRRRMLHDAIPNLESSERLGFPTGRTLQGYRILGESLFEVGRYDEAIDALTKAIDLDPADRRELLPLLAESQLSALKPLTEQSLETIESYLADSTLAPNQRWEGELIRLRALIALGRWRQVEERIQSELQTSQSVDLEQQTDANVYRDHLTLMQAIAQVRRAMGLSDQGKDESRRERRISSELSKELNATLQQLNELQNEAGPMIANRAQLWSARAYLVQGLNEEALAQLMSVRQHRPFDAEATVAALEEIELLARLGRGSETIQTARYMIRELGDAREFDGKLIAFEEFQRRMMNVLERLRQHGQYESAIDVARSLPPVISVVEAMIQEGITFREWAAATLANGTDASGEVARPASIQARARYRAAGDAFARAAEAKFNTREYVSAQWLAIDSYQQGRHFTQSIRLLKPYLQYEAKTRLPRGLVAYGRALLAEDDPDTAIEALTRCIIEHPRDPLRYDARLLAAMAYAEKGDLDNARRLLQDNLGDGELTPQSPAWRDSLLTLGELLYERGYRNHLAAQQTTPAERMERMQENQPILEEAIRRLDEAVERYWPIPRAKAAAYLSAQANVMSSQWSRLQSKLPEILDAARRTLRGQADQELQVALDRFVYLHRYLSQQEEEQRLPQKEKAILRNCLLAEADVLREMSRLEDAADAYRNVELRYMNEPTALEAILGRAACVRDLGRPNEADMLIRQASVVLQRIPPEMDDRFVETTRYDRTGWEQLLGWMNQRVTGSGV